MRRLSPVKLNERRAFACGSAVVSLSSAPDITEIAAALADGTVRLIDPGQPLAAKVQVHEGPVVAAAFHRPSDAFLTAGEDGRIRRISLEGTVGDVARLGSKWIESLVVDPITGCWAAATGHDLHIFTPDLTPWAHHPLPSVCCALAVDPAGGRVVAPHYGGVSLIPIDRAGGDADETYWWKGSHCAACVSPNGRWLASAMTENALHVWPLQGGADFSMRGYPAKPRSLAWTADSSFLLTGGVDRVLAWPFDGSGPPGQAPITFGRGYGGVATRVAAHPTAPVAAVGFENGAVLCGNLKAREVVTLEEPGFSAVTALCWSQDGTSLVVGHEDGDVILHEIV